MNKESSLYAKDKIDAYVQGCENIGYMLEDAVEGVIKKGKKPTILIPSRGALPITLIALSKIGELEPENRLLDPSKTKYYPHKIFNYLSDNRIVEKGDNPEKVDTKSEVDVILYPFTADVTTEKREETLARKLRYSATRAFLDLVEQKGDSMDLCWYYFLMGKMQREAYNHSTSLEPSGIVKSLQRIPPDQNREIILIDTVISGRASSQIIGSFKALGKDVLPILAVDITNGPSRFRDNLQQEILNNTRVVWWNYMRESTAQKGPFIEFPLITEDQGAALLGVTAINFTNFNQEGYFNSVDTKFPASFSPQSCVWSLPPTEVRKNYIPNFHNFLNRCIGDRLQNMAEERWQDTVQDIKTITKNYGELNPREVHMLAQVDQGTTGKESSSHIISLTLPDRQAQKWVRDFSKTLDGNCGAEKFDFLRMSGELFDRFFGKKFIGT